MGDRPEAHLPESSLVPARAKALFFGADRYRRHSYGDNYPLGFPRVSLTLDLIRAYGAISAGEYRTCRMALHSELEWFHTGAYVSAMQRCEALGAVPDRYRRAHNLGTFENPYFPGFFSTPATAAAGSILAAEAVLDGYAAFTPAGGMHHARPEQAHGFCYLGKFTISTELFVEVVSKIIDEAPRCQGGAASIMITGGGGYHPLAVARCWTGVWAVLSGRVLPGEVPQAGRETMRAVEWEPVEEEPHYERLFHSRFDGVREGAVRPEIEERITRLLGSHPLFRARQGGGGRRAEYPRP